MSHGIHESTTHKDEAAIASITAQGTSEIDAMAASSLWDGYKTPCAEFWITLIAADQMGRAQSAFASFTYNGTTLGMLLPNRNTYDPETDLLLERSTGW